MKIFLDRKHYHVCVSGGIDSLAIAHWLKYKYRIPFNIIHFNHNCQDINDDMERSVFLFAYEHGIPMDSYKNYTQSDHSENGLRQWRLEMMGKIGGDFITGHHLNDAVENYLMNCFHGKPEHKPIQEKTVFPSFQIFHPFLKIPKKELREYAQNNDLLKYVTEDPSNTNTKFKRNWIRNVIIPELMERDMGIETIVRKKFYS